MDRPVEREFDAMKGKTGVDRTTQIEENDPELFNFDYEVEPIVEVRGVSFRLYSVRSLKPVACSYLKKNN